MNKKQLMAGTLAALTVASTTMPAALAAQPDTAVPYAVMSTKSLEDAGLTLLSQEEGTTTAPRLNRPCKSRSTMPRMASRRASPCRVMLMGI